MKHLRTFFVLLLLIWVGVAAVLNVRLINRWRNLPPPGEPRPHRTLVDDCVASVFDIGREHAKIDRRAWITIQCKDGHWGTYEIDDASSLRPESTK